MSDNRERGVETMNGESTPSSVHARLDPSDEAVGAKSGPPSTLDRLRANAAVRLGVQLLVAAVVGVGVFAVSGLLESAVFGEDDPPRGYRLASRLVAAFAMVAAYAGVVHKFELRPDAEPSRMDIRVGVVEGLRGFIIGTLLFSSVVAVVALSGGVSVAAGTAWTTLVFSFGFSLSAAIIEEVLFRGVLFRILNESWGTTLAILFTAAFFGGAHGMNANATLMSNIAIALEAGVLLACVYLLTGRLWMVIGLHTAWNFVQGGVFGLAVSGNAAKGWLATTVEGPEWMTGGAFGLEASLVAVLLCLLVAVAAYVIARRRGLVIAPFWARRTKSTPSLAND